MASLQRLQNVLLHTARIRWGIWIDQYIVQLDRHNGPVMEDGTANAIFNFEPNQRRLII